MRSMPVKIAAVIAAICVFVWAAIHALAWAVIADPTADERRALATTRVPAARAVYAMAQDGSSLTLRGSDLALIEPGPCRRETRLHFFGGGARLHGVTAQVTHLCRLDLTDRDGQRAAMVIVRDRWLWAEPEGSAVSPRIAEPHEVSEMLARIGG